MLYPKLPVSIYPEKLCKAASVEGQTLSGSIYLNSLKNIANLLKQDDNPVVSVSLTFSMDMEGIAKIIGKIQVDLTMQCQRCLEAMRQKVEVEILVSPVASDAMAARLPSAYEPLLMTNGEVILAEWIAEELHLALPLAPRHETQCISYSDYNFNKT